MEANRTDLGKVYNQTTPKDKEAKAAMLSIQVLVSYRVAARKNSKCRFLEVGRKPS